MVANPAITIGRIFSGTFVLYPAPAQAEDVVLPHPDYDASR